MLLTWTAFLWVHTLPAGLIAGILFFTDFGIAFQWLFVNVMIRILIGVCLLALMILLNPFWVLLFLKASPSVEFGKYPNLQKLYIQNVCFNSWFIGFIILLCFNWPQFNVFWPLFLLCLGFFTLPWFDRYVSFEKLSLIESSKKIFSFRYSVFYSLILLIVIWFAGIVTITF